MKLSNKPVIGFEVHIELATNSKMFCGCKNDPFGAQSPNSLTCPVCLGLPGALPVPNKKAIEWTIMLGLALNCHIATESKFDRKHYFYPDLPKGYQISQYDLPFCTDGYIDTSEGRVNIERVHLEEDTGKLQHTKLNGKSVSLVDFNRGGVPLVEIVTKPDIRSTTQAIEYSKKLRQIARSIKISECDMEKGSMRLEANISWGLDLGYKVEVKNVNSFKYIGKSIDYELKRQKNILEENKIPVQETRGWDEKTNTTRSQRTKETAADYRYFPEPDIPPIIISQEWISEIKSKIPELPEARKDRWINSFNLRPDYAIILSQDLGKENYYEDLLNLSKENNFDTNKIIGLIINKQIGKEVTPNGVLKLFKALSVDKIEDNQQIEGWVNQAIKADTKAASDYKSGKDAAISSLIGKVMAFSKGKADGKVVKTMIEKILRGN